MATQYQAACRGEITREMARVAEREATSPEQIRAEVADGRLVIPANRNHLGPSGRLDPIGIGRAVTTKINANIGASPVRSSTDEELEKLDWAVQFGADAAMDLSTGGPLDETRERLIAHATVPIGTVPIYEMIVGRDVEDLTYDDILACIEKQARQGVDFFTIHAGVLREHLPLAARRLAGMVSRGGTLLVRWMTHHNRENPMYELFDEISAIMREYDVSYSLGDGMRPGCLADASDEAQFAELRTMAELVHRAHEAGVQTIVEGPGHVPFDQIEHNMKLQAELCDGAPFYVLGPIVTDVAPGYDHITSAIGATAAAFHGASFLCYVTPKEHLGLPRLEDVRAGVVAYKIAAHAADVARGLPGARQWDDEISKARAALDWPRHFALALDPEMARELHDADTPKAADFCAMCGHAWCAVRMSKEVPGWQSGHDTDTLAQALDRLPSQQAEFLRRRRGLAPCHSAVAPNAEQARSAQQEAMAASENDAG